MLGSAPKAVDEPEKIFDCVASWVWISKPDDGFPLHDWFPLPEFRFCGLGARSAAPGERAFKRPGTLTMPVGRQLQLVRDVEQPRLVETVADQLQADRHTGAGGAGIDIPAGRPG